MRVHAYASQPHYADHLAPVWNALPAERRGAFHAINKGATRARELKLNYVDATPPAGVDPVLVAAVVDYRVVPTRSIYLNHGVGQTWRNSDGSLIPTGVACPKPGVRLFLTPGPHATAATIQSQRAAAVVEVGSPKLDPWLGHKPREPLVVVSSHWDHRAAPESRSALPHYLPALRSIRAPLALHAHPRLQAWASARAAELGIEFIPTFDEVLERATVYATDCSSTLYEFAATGRPVVVLNGPNYRREHHHGLRFWEASTVGVNVNGPSELPAAVEEAIEDAPARVAARAAALKLAYAPLDGRATQRAATAILSLLRDQASGASGVAA